MCKHLTGLVLAASKRRTRIYVEPGADAPSPSAKGKAMEIAKWSLGCVRPVLVGCAIKTIVLTLVAFAMLVGQFSDAARSRIMWPRIRSVSLYACLTVNVLQRKQANTMELAIVIALRDCTLMMP